VDGRTSLGDPNWTREGPFCVVADVPKRDLPGPFSYVESFSTPTGPSSFGAAYPAASVPNEEPVAPRSGRDTTPAASWAFAQSRLPRRLPEAHSRRALPLPLNHRGPRFAPVRGACGVAFVTTRPQPAALVRVVTNHGSEAHKTERERERTSTSRSRRAAVREGGTGTEQSSVLERPAEWAEATPRPGQLPGLGARCRAAWADRGAVRGHARPARPPDRPQLPHRSRPARPLVQRGLDKQRQAHRQPAPVRLAHPPGQQTRRLPLPHLGRQPRARQPHRSRHQPPALARTPGPARRMGV
jgi:hypothetical protein